MVALVAVQQVDLSVLIALHQSAFGEYAWTATMLAESLASANGWGLALQNGRAISGFVLCQTVADDSEILTLAVEKTQQRRGYGRMLLQAVYDAAKARHHQRIFLEVSEDNQAALALYNSFGFQKIGRRPAYYPCPTGAVAAQLMAFDL